MLAQTVLKSVIMDVMKEKPTINLKRLEQLMERKDWGLVELSKYSGIKYETVYSLRAGRRKNPSMDTLKPIADALNTTVDYLLGTTDDDTPPMQKLPDSIRQLAEIASRLSQMSQHELLRIAATLAKLELDQRATTAPPLSGDDRAALLSIAEELKHSPGQSDLLESLESLLRKPPGQGLDDPSQDQ